MKTAAEEMFEKLGYEKVETANKLTWQSKTSYRDKVIY